MTKSELLAQAEALEWALNGPHDPDKILRLQVQERAAELRAQAAKAADPLPVAWLCVQTGKAITAKQKLDAQGHADHYEYPLHFNPDPRIAEYRELLLETLEYVLPDEPLADDSPDGDLVKRIRAALKGE